jgi:PAS domain S-box-containing protein
MKEKLKTKKQLIDELSALRQKNVALEESLALRNSDEKALWERGEKYRRLIENSHDIIYSLNPEGVFTFVSSSWTALLGHKVNQVVGKPFQQFVHPDDISVCEVFLRKVIAMGQRQSGIEYRVQHIDGSWRWHTSNASPSRSEAGIIISYEGIASDITERKQAEEALKESQQQFSDIINFLPDATFVIDEEGKVIAWNRAMEEMTGAKAEDILGKSDYEYSVPFYGIRRPILIDLTLGFDKECEKKYDFVKRKGNVLLAAADAIVRGVPRALWGKAVPLYDSRGNVIGAIESIRDITVHKQAQEALQKAHDELEIKVRERTAELEATNKELESFAYSISHDLRAPLRAIDGFSRMLIVKMAGRLNDDEKRRFEVIRENTRMMGRLIDDLLSFSRLGRQSMAFSTINMPELINQVWEELLAVNPHRKISVKIGTLPAAFGDVSLIRQVLVNILSNAVKFTRKKQNAVIEIDGKIEGSEALYIIRDNGAGFDMNYAQKLFCVFQRLHSQDEYEGTGAGLAIVQRIIQRHSGRVWAEGTVDKGATFYFTLPDIAANVLPESPDSDRKRAEN